MDMKKVREKKLSELVKMRDEWKLRYADEYFEMRMGKLKDTRKPNKTRKEIARIEIAIMEKTMSKEDSPMENKDKLNKESKDGKAKT
jgi:ribosomal protein L29